MGASVGGKKGFVSEINVTPFVDVMLVLLIIFMVTAPMMTEGLDVDLPQTRAVETLPTESDNMILTIRKDGVIFSIRTRWGWMSFRIKSICSSSSRTSSCFSKPTRTWPTALSWT